jgi:hypothetical protein
MKSSFQHLSTNHYPLSTSYSRLPTPDFGCDLHSSELDFRLLYERMYRQTLRFVGTVVLNYRRLSEKSMRRFHDTDRYVG